MRDKPNPIIKVMLDGRYKRGGTRRWCVAVGQVSKPTRGCLWLVVGFYSSERGANNAYERIPAERGRAMFDLDNPRLRFINPDGKLLRCLEVEEKLLS